MHILLLLASAPPALPAGPQRPGSGWRRGTQPDELPVRRGVGSTTLLAAFVSALLVASPGLAVDGVIEINQVCAVQTGCLPGDAPGFPVTLRAGSYRLTSNLDGVAGADGIDWAVPPSSIDVGLDIDLNGFEIRRTGGAAINIVGTTATSTTVRNGRIFQPGAGGIIARRLLAERVRIIILGPGIGIDCSDRCILRDVSVHATQQPIKVGASSRIDGGDAQGGLGFPAIEAGHDADIRGVVVGNASNGGIHAGLRSRIVGNTVDAPSTADGDTILCTEQCIIEGNVVSNGNTGDAIECGDDCIVQGNIVSDGGTIGDGIRCNDDCVIRQNTVSGTGGNGILAGVRASVHENVTSNNAFDGIDVGTSSVVIGNSSSGNTGDGIVTDNAATIRNNSADSNSLDGIDAGDGSRVSGNTARSNAQFGLRSESTLVGFSGNTFGNNNGGPSNPQTSSGRDLGGNQCDGAATCP